MRNKILPIILFTVILSFPYQQIRSGVKPEKNTKITLSNKKLTGVVNKTNILPPCADLLVPFNGGAGWTKVVNFYTNISAIPVLVGEAASNSSTITPIDLGFQFSFLGVPETQCYISTNGVVTFDSPFRHFDHATTLPLSGGDISASMKMIAGYWSDIDLTVAGRVYYKIEPHRFTVLYDHVGQTGQTNAKLNTFEIILTDGTDPLIGVGKNIGLSYGDMQWTAQNSDVGVQTTPYSYYKIGSFTIENSDEYWGMFGNSGVDWLDYRNTSCNGLDDKLNLDASNFLINEINIGDNDAVNIASTEYDLNWITIANCNMKIDFSSDGGNTWSSVADRINSIDLFYENIFPQVNSNNCFLRIYAENYPSRTVKFGPFIVSKAFNFISPKDGDVYTANSTQQIIWSNILNGSLSPKRNDNTDPEANNSLKKNNGHSSGFTSELSYSIDNGESWIKIADGISVTTEPTSVYSWNVPATVSSKCKLRMELKEALGRPADLIHEIYAESDGNFSIANPIQTNGQITLATPNGGETYTGGSYNYINWRRTGLVPGSQSLELSTDGGSTWNKISSVPIAGVMRYSWLAPKINSNKCLVKICNGVTGKEYDRSNSYFSIVTPTLLKNYPNPFNPTTRISFSLERNAYTTLRVYNTIGQQVTELVNRELKAGMYEYEFNAQNLPSGVYLYNLTVDGKSQINKMMLLK